MEFASVIRLNLTQKKISSHDLTNNNEDRSFLKTALAWKGSVTPKVISRVLIAGLYATFINIAGMYFPNLHLSITPFEYCGVVLGLLLVARVNAGVDRWWEARKIWGSIVNQSRNLAIIGYQYSTSKHPVLKEFIKWVAVWPYAMKQHLRDERNYSEIKHIITEDQFEEMCRFDHMPMFVGAKLASLLKKMKTTGLDNFSFLRAERERALLIDAIGACERIKSTPIPLVIAIKTRRFILLFLLLLPFGLIDQVFWIGPFVAMLTAYPLFSLDEIGLELQNPFSSSNLSHLPLIKICNNIEKNVLSLESLLKEDSHQDTSIAVKLETQGKCIVLDYTLDD